jgi:hypothetical protein
MDITDIRLGNYKELRKRFRKMEDEQGIPERGELNRFGEFTGVNSRYLSHINNERKSIGHATARQLEEAFKLPHGWMDVDHLAGFVHMDSRAKEFGALAMRLYMKDPEGVRALLMKYMENQMFSENVRSKPTTKSSNKSAK